MEEVKGKLREENVEVYRFALESITEDMTLSAENLDDSDTGVATQDMQADILRKLKMLLDAFDMKRREQQKQQQGGGGGGGGGGKPPLVPDLVQLNLIKKMQENLLQKTEQFERRYNRERDDLSLVEKQLLQRLSDKQDQLGDVLKRFISKFEKEKEEYEKDEKE
jgi:hypothetical protein